MAVVYGWNGSRSSLVPREVWCVTGAGAPAFPELPFLQLLQQTYRALHHHLTTTRS